MDVPVRNASLVDQVFNVLLSRISEEIYRAGSQLPTEFELADEFNVSRSTIRTAILRLEDRKLIYRKPGVGTYVSDSIHISNPLNEFIEFSKLIRESGFEPGYVHVSTGIIHPDETVQQELNLSPDDQVIRIDKVFTANQDPIIYVINHIPHWLVQESASEEQVLAPEFTQNFRNFFEETCNQKVSYFISQVRADVFKNISAPEMMDIYSGDTPTLVIDQVGYNQEEKPIISTIEYHPGNWMTFNIIRRWG
jgi:GntR family transcriptional regulator